MAKLKKLEVFSGYLGEAIFLAIALGIFSIIFKEDFVNTFLNYPLDFSNDYIVFFYILSFIGAFSLILHAVFRTMMKFMDAEKQKVN